MSDIDHFLLCFINLFTLLQIWHFQDNYNIYDQLMFYC